MKPKVFTIQLPSATANSIATSQTPLTAGNLTLTSTPFVLDATRRVAITSAGNDSSHNFTITGTDRNGFAQSEVLAGPNTTTATSVLDYATVITISISAAATGAITVGTSAKGSTAVCALDYYGQPETGVQVALSGSVTYQLEYTLDNVINAAPPYTWTSYSSSSSSAQVTNVVNNSDVQPISAIRSTTTAGVGTLTLTVLQTGLTGS